MKRLVLALALLLPAELPAAEPDNAASADAFLAAKAEWLGHITRFVLWPDSAFASAEAPFRLCLAGAESFAAPLAFLRGQTVAARPLRIETVHSVAELARCQIAYFGIAADDELRIAAQDGRLPKLLGVAGDARFTEQGGTLALVTEGGPIRLHVNFASVRASRLQFSAKLLELAHVQHPAPLKSG